MNLEHIGWTPALSFYLSELSLTDGVVGRVARAHPDRCLLLTAKGELEALWQPPLAVPGERPLETLAVGDWCVVTPRADRFFVAAVLPRHTCFRRARSSGSRAEQVLVANVDVAFLVTGLDQDFSPRRIERYLTLTRHSGAQPVVLLNKVDICADLEARLGTAVRAAPEVTVHAVSALTGEGVAVLTAELQPGRTGVLLGSSGAGKSTLINQLLGEELLRTAPVRVGDDTGRHTTTHRELLPLTGGGALVDTPGLREVGVLGDPDDLDETFPEIAAAATACRFGDCRHEGEPGCAVLDAVAAGTVDAARLESYLHLRREAESAERRRSAFTQRNFERQRYGRYRGWLKETQRFKGR